MRVTCMMLAAVVLVGACKDEGGSNPAPSVSGGSSGSGGRRTGGSGGSVSSGGSGGSISSGGSGGSISSGGSSGAGGSVGSGGSSGSGGGLGDASPGSGGSGGGAGDAGDEVAPAPLCTSTSGGLGNDGLIDDFEDANADILARDARMGSWWLAINTSATVTGMMVSGPPLSVAGGRMGKGLHVVGAETVETGWGVSLSATVVADGANGCYDASQYTSLKISLKGKVGRKVYVHLLTAGVRAVKESAGHYRREVTLTNAYQDLTIRFKPDFMPGWGSPPELDVSKVYGVDVSPVIAPGALDYDFFIDNVQFAK